MARTPNPYTKLPGRGLRRVAVAISATRCRLWLAADHLLAVDFTIASEDYRRFYFRDIEAFVIRRTARRQVWNWVFLVLILLTAGPFSIGVAHRRASGGFLIAALSIAAFWLAFILINTLRGATCQTHIRTAVQFEQLPSLGRLPVARKVLARLQPLIVAAQGAATPEELAAAPWMAAVQAKRRLAARRSGDKGRLHSALFALLIAEAILTGVFYAILPSGVVHLPACSRCSAASSSASSPSCGRATPICPTRVRHAHEVGARLLHPEVRRRVRLHDRLCRSTSRARRW